MRTEVRFLLAIALMILVLVGTNLLFPPVPPDQVTPGADSAAVPAAPPESETTQEPEAEEEPALPPAVSAEEQPPQPRAPAVEEALIMVEGPLYRFTFTNLGGRLVSAELLDFPSFVEPGPVQLVPRGSDGALGNRIVVGADTLDLRGLPFRVSPQSGVRLIPDGPPEELRLIYQHPTEDFSLELVYTFVPNSYVVSVRGQVRGLDRGLLLTDLGSGLALNETRAQEEVRALAYVGNHLRDGIQSEGLRQFEGSRVQDGPFHWVAFKSKHFVLALLAGVSDEDERYLGGLIAVKLSGENQVALGVTEPLLSDGSFGHRLFMGPQELARLSAIGNDLEDVNPYGWRFFRPVVRPFVAVITTILIFLHGNLSVGYGWVLILFGVMMRVVLFPLNQKAMRAQIRNMAVQPLLKEIQTKYKDNPERMQKEMMKLYKEHGFNPVAGCLPMFLPWPVLIALFFVFQNTIELRGVPFLWLPDLSAPDPFYILPVFLGISMFLLQWVSMRSMEQPNPQMKMMMWIMPVFMVFIFFNLASGLNLYYATANIATLPQQFWVAKERQKASGAKPALASVE
jgi:YidC/Oxa1 family membrane protein insertase